MTNSRTGGRRFAKRQTSRSVAAPELADIMRTEEAAAYLGLSPATLETWRSRKSDGPPFVRQGRAIRYRRRDLDAYQSSHMARSTAEYEQRPSL